jgi:hypothetical protein
MSEPNDDVLDLLSGELVDAGDGVYIVGRTAEDICAEQGTREDD